MVDAEELLFQEGSNTISAKWNEVKDYYYSQVGHLQPTRYHIVTLNGEFVFTNTIKNYRILRAVIERRSIHAAVTEWAERKETAPALGQQQTNTIKQ